MNRKRLRTRYVRNWQLATQCVANPGSPASFTPTCPGRTTGRYFALRNPKHGRSTKSNPSRTTGQPASWNVKSIAFTSRPWATPALRELLRPRTADRGRQSNSGIDSLHGQERCRSALYTGRRPAKENLRQPIQTAPAVGKGIEGGIVARVEKHWPDIRPSEQGKKQDQAMTANLHDHLPRS